MIKELQALGLSYYESKILYALVISQAKLSMAELSRKAKIPFGKVFSIANSLNEKGLLKFTDGRPKMAYVDNFSNIISRLIEKKKSDVEDLISKTRDFAITADKAKGESSKFFQIGTTLEENKDLQSKAFREAKAEVCQILNTHYKPETNRASKLVWEREIKRKVMEGVVFKAIYPKAVDLPQIIKNLSKSFPERFQVRRIDTSFTRIDIIDRTKVLIKLTYEDVTLFGGLLLVENEKLARNLMRIFNQLWEHADLDQ